MGEWCGGDGGDGGDDEGSVEVADGESRAKLNAWVKVALAGTCDDDYLAIDTFHLVLYLGSFGLIWL